MYCQRGENLCVLCKFNMFVEIIAGETVVKSHRNIRGLANARVGGLRGWRKRKRGWRKRLAKANIRGLANIRGWRKTVGNLIEYARFKKGLSRASIYWHTQEKQRRRVSSNSRCKKVLYIYIYIYVYIERERYTI